MYSYSPSIGRNKLIFLWFMLLILVISLKQSFVFGKEDTILIPRRQYNVILISVDSLRADHLSCYGYFRNTSPNIDKLANEGILFEQGISQADWTLPSLVSLFTSKYISVHGICWFNKLPDSELTFTEVLKKCNYRTAAFYGKLNLTNSNLFQGFDFCDGKKDNLASFKDLVPSAINWLKENRNSKFFLFLHGLDVHEPYHTPNENIFDPDYNGIADYICLTKLARHRVYRNFYFTEGGKMISLTSKDISHIIAHYDAGISYADGFIGELLRSLDELNLTDKTIIILLSSHGEELFDRGVIMQHGPRYYDEIIRVPLIIKHPQIKGSIRIRTQAQLIDVMPTILDFLDIPKNKEIQGNSLISLIEGNASADFNEYVFSGIFTVRSLKWKLIDKKELYNLIKDPKELNNLAINYPEIYIKLDQEWFKQKEKNTRLRTEIENKIQDEKELDNADYYW